MGNSSSQEEGAPPRHVTTKGRARSGSKVAEAVRKPSDSEKSSGESPVTEAAKVSNVQEPPANYVPSKPVAVKGRPAHNPSADIPQNSVPIDGGSFAAAGNHASYQHNEFSHVENVDDGVIPQNTDSISPKSAAPLATTNVATTDPTKSTLSGGQAGEKFKATMSANNSSSTSSTSSADRPAPLRRKSTLLLQGEHEPEVDEDMEFHKLNLQPGAQPNATKPLSRAGSGDEIQLGDEYYSETKYETLISWQQGGEKVYVTGSFTGWRRMIKLNKREDGTFSVLLKLPVGTHRMRFVVDNELRCSDFISSATDSMGNLVNYIEVGLDSDTDMSMEPLHRTTSNYAEQRKAQEMTLQQDEKYLAERQQQQEEEQLKSESVEQAQVQEDQQQQPQQSAPVVDTDIVMNDDDEALNGGGYERFHEELPEEPVYKFTSDIPSVFTDTEIMEQFVASDFVTPPQLPPHLESVILNSNSNEKDNNSVLPIPNHVVLNHLATTSIKHNVLAVASISRYSRKYVTQILYAPL